MTIKQHGGVFGRNPSFNNASVETLSIAGTALSSTAAELNILDGVTADATELNYLDGASTSVVTASKAVLANASANIPFASGNGIDFSATAGTGASELFDDYEQGTFTASLTATTSGTIPLDFNRMSYTKIVRLVHCQGEIRVASLSSPTGDIKFNGLPYASTSDGQRSGRLAFAFEANTLVGSPSGTLQAKSSAAGTTFDVRIVDGDVVTRLSSLLAVGTATVFSFCYVAD
jgi:hypothetical protein